MQIVTGYRGQAHITSNDDQGRNQGVFGQNSYVLSVGSQFTPTLVSANELRIADGEAVMQGVHFRVDPSSFDSVTITNGTQGMNRKDLVVCRYTKDGSTGVENCEWVVIEGTPTSGTAARPSAVSGDILDGALVADMPFFEIVLSGINVTAVNSLFSKLMTMQEIQALAKTNESGISELNSKMEKYSYGFTSTTAGKQITITCSNINVFWFPIFIMIGGHVGLIITQGANMPAVSNIVGNMSTFLTITTISNGIELTITGNGSRGRMIFMAPDDVLNMLTVRG